MIRNMKLNGKLGLGFGLMILITLALALFSFFRITSINRATSHLSEFAMVRYSLLNYAEAEITNLRRLTAFLPFYASDHGELARVFSDALASGIEVQRLIGEWMASVNADDRVVPAVAATNLERMRNVNSLVDRYIAEVVRAMETSVRDYDREGQLRAFDVGGGIVREIDNIFAMTKGATQQNLRNIQNEIDDYVYVTVWITAIVALACFVTGIVVARATSKIVADPVNEVAAVVQSVASGNFGINLRADLPKDEVGMMTANVYSLVETVRAMTDDISRFSHQLNEIGDIDYRIDPSAYSGGFRVMIEDLNALMEGYVSDTMKIISVLNDVNEGKFSHDLRQLPGKKALLNKTVDSLMASLNAVKSEVGQMVTAASDMGDLHFQIDAAKFRGGWADIMQGLNKVAAAVDRPITEIREVMGNLTKGDFSRKISGGYAGDFLAIKNAVNGTIDALSQYISEISDSLSKIAGGDLTMRIGREYVGSFAAIKDSINNIANALNQTMTEITAASEQVLIGAQQISSSAMDLANGSTTQASSVEELNASVDLISQQTRMNAESANEANDLSRLSTENARAGNETMKLTLDAMRQIKEASQSISRIVSTIQDIAFQTNLLALNASVEAARAGEHGRGFSVVADEVRSLAVRSQTAASETTDLIGSSINTVDSGSAITEATAQKLDTIVENANRLMSIIQAITVASNEQNDAIHQVSIGLGQISQVVQSNSAISEETAAASQELNSQAEILKQLVSVFRL